MRYSYATVALPDLSPERAIEELALAGYRGVEWKVGDSPRAASSGAAGCTATGARWLRGRPTASGFVTAARTQA
jgi:hypothetical protein